MVIHEKSSTAEWSVEEILEQLRSHMKGYNGMNRAAELVHRLREDKNPCMQGYDTLAVLIEEFSDRTIEGQQIVQLLDGGLLFSAIQRCGEKFDATETYLFNVLKDPDVRDSFFEKYFTISIPYGESKEEANFAVALLIASTKTDDDITTDGFKEALAAAQKVVESTLK